MRRTASLGSRLGSRCVEVFAVTNQQGAQGHGLAGLQQRCGGRAARDLRLEQSFRGRVAATACKPLMSTMPSIALGEFR
jgi:hypothetical protein